MKHIRIINSVLLILFVMLVRLEGQISPVPSDFSCDVILLSEDFELGIPADWNTINPDSAKISGFNEGWILDRDTTFTGATGPDMAQSGDYYIYCDGSGPVTRGSVVPLRSPEISLTGINNPSLTFYLNMHGTSGLFYVNVVTGTTVNKVLPDVNGNVAGGLHASNEWEEIYIDLTPYLDQSIRLEFVTMKPGGSISPPGDIAIDNVMVCGGSSTVPTLSQWGVIIVFFSLLIFGIIAIQQERSIKLQL